MRSYTDVSLILLFAACASGACDKSPPRTIADRRAAEAAAPIDDDMRQVVTVVSDGWNDFRAVLQRYERTRDKKWRRVGHPVDVVLGRQGYGWGRGLHGTGAPQGRPGPSKREGDGRSPAGVFAIGNAYGYAASRDDIALPYTQATDELRCVDDPKSSHYNLIVSNTDTPIDWQSAERMRRDDDLYMLTIVVAHNAAPTRAGAGSCIFLHLWEGPDKGMSGCIAMSKDALVGLAEWLVPNAAALVALPRAEYEALKRPWGLPFAPELGSHDSR